jgi:hypothetical protein
MWNLLSLFSHPLTLSAHRVFVVNIMIPGPPYLSFVAYLEGDKVGDLHDSHYPHTHTHTHLCSPHFTLTSLYLLLISLFLTR